MLLSIISSPDLLETLRQEIAPFARIKDSSGQAGLTLDINGLLNSCPTIKATFFETMRLYTNGTSHKKVLQDITLSESAADAAAFWKPRPQTYRIAAGSYLVTPHGTMQNGPSIVEKSSEV
jgi:hypothetical protein